MGHRLPRGHFLQAQDAPDFSAGLREVRLFEMILKNISERKGRGRLTYNGKTLVPPSECPIHLPASPHKIVVGDCMLLAVFFQRRLVRRVSLGAI